MGKIIGIVAVDRNWGIGKKNGLLFSLKEDMKFFRATTLDQICTMGYNTLMSFPNSQPLPKRTNVVLAPAETERTDCTIVHSLEEMLGLIYTYTQKDDRDVYVIGGAMFYKSMLPYYDEVLVTKVDADGEAEVFFPNLDRIKEFSCEVNREVIDNGYKLQFTTYRRREQ